MSELNELNISSKPLRSDVLNQIASDINKSIESSKDAKKKMRHMADKTNIHLKTLNRICRLENKPNYMTVFKIYRYLLNVTDDNEVLNQCPAVIKSFLLTTNPAVLQKTKTYTEDVDLKISKNPIFAEIYALSSMAKIKSSDIKNRFGDYGLDLLKEMCNTQVLKHLGSGEYILGDQQASLSTESLLTLGNQFVKTYAKPENSSTFGQNHVSFTAEALSDEGYQNWLAIDDQAYKQKLQILQDSSNLGKNKIFSFTVTDTIKKNEDDL